MWSKKGGRRRTGNPTPLRRVTSYQAVTAAIKTHRTCNQRIFRLELNATDGRSDQNYLQLNLQSSALACNRPVRTRIICNWNQPFQSTKNLHFLDFRNSRTGLRYDAAYSVHDSRPSIIVQLISMFLTFWIFFELQIILAQCGWLQVHSADCKLSCR